MFVVISRKEPVSVVAVRISNEDRSSVKIHISPP